MTITATDGAVNASSGAFLTFGGITIQSELDSVNTSNGGGLLVLGGASVVKSMHIGRTLNVMKDAYLNNLYITSNSYANFIESPNNLRAGSSFNPIHFTQYNNTSASILTIHDTGVIINSLRIGGTIDSPTGYLLNSDSNDSSNLKIIPYNNNASIIIGTAGNLSNLTIHGTGDAVLAWNASSSTFKLTDVKTQLSDAANVRSLNIFSPDIAGNVSISSNGSDIVLNIGADSSGGKVKTILSNNVGNATVAFDPNNVTCSNLSISGDVYSTFSGPSTFEDRLEMSGNALHQTIQNVEYTGKWIYMGELLNQIQINISTMDTAIQFRGGVSSGNLMAQRSGSGSGDNPRVVIYNDTSSNRHLFLYVLPESITNVDIIIGNARSAADIEHGVQPRCGSEADIARGDCQFAERQRSGEVLDDRLAEWLRRAESSGHPCIGGHRAAGEIATNQKGVFGFECHIDPPVAEWIRQLGGLCRDAGIKGRQRRGLHMVCHSRGFRLVAKSVPAHRLGGAPVVACPQHGVAATAPSHTPSVQAVRRKQRARTPPQGAAHRAPP
jgi:hypothetical protein